MCILRETGVVHSSMGQGVPGPHPAVLCYLGSWGASKVFVSGEGGTVQLDWIDNLDSLNGGIVQLVDCIDNNQ